MTLDELRAVLGGYPGAWEDTPFGPDALVLKVGSRMFALVSWNEQPVRISLKCDPVEAEALRAVYPAVTGAWHFNKRHWNSVRLDGSVPEDDLIDMIDHSYELVVQRLPKRERSALPK